MALRFADGFDSYTVQQFEPRVEWDGEVLFLLNRPKPSPNQGGAYTNFNAFMRDLYTPLIRQQLQQETPLMGLLRTPPPRALGQQIPMGGLHYHQLRAQEHAQNYTTAQYDAYAHAAEEMDRLQRRLEEQQRAFEDYLRLQERMRQNAYTPAYWEYVPPPVPPSRLRRWLNTLWGRR